MVKNTMTEVLPCIESYFAKHHKPLCEKFRELCINFGPCKTLLIPKNDVYAKLLKDLQNPKITQTQLHEALTHLWRYMFFNNFKDKKLESGGMVNCIGQYSCKITASKNNKFELYSGEKLDKKAECRFMTELIPALNITGKEEKPFCFVEVVSGEVAFGGAPMDRVRGSDEIEVESISYSGANEDNYDEIMQKKKEFLSKNPKFDDFAKLIGGLLMFLNKSGVDEYSDIKKKVACVLSCCTPGSFIAIIRPHYDPSISKESDFLPARLYREWSMAEAHIEDYCSLFSEFIKTNLPCDMESRHSEIRKIIDRPTKIHSGTADLMELYECEVPKICGQCISPSEKLWCDEVIYKCSVGIDFESLLEHYRGNDFNAERTFGNFEHESQMSSSGFRDSESRKARGSVGAFIESQYCLMCCLVDDECKKKLENCKHPLSQQMRAFCVINS